MAQPPNQVPRGEIPGRIGHITREDFGARVPQSKSNSRFPSRSPHLEQRRSASGIRAPPPGFQPGNNLLSPDAPVFTPGGYIPGPEQARLPKKPQHNDHKSRQEEQLWDHMLFMQNGADRNGYAKTNGPRQSRQTNGMRFANSGREKNAPQAYQPPRIYPTLFPSDQQRYDSDVTFSRDLYHNIDGDIWMNKEDDRRYARNDYGYASDTNSDSSYDKHMGLYDAEPYGKNDAYGKDDVYGKSDPYGPKFYQSDHRAQTPPNYFIQKSWAENEQEESMKYRRHFDPDEFYKEELLPLHMRREPFQMNAPPPPTNSSHTYTGSQKNSDSSTPSPGASNINSQETSLSSEGLGNAQATKEAHKLPEFPDMTGLHFAKMSADMLKFGKIHHDEIVDQLCQKELAHETEPYYIWKYVCHALGVEISWPEAEELKTPEIEDKARKLVLKAKEQIRDNVKLQWLDDGIIVNEEYGKALVELVVNLERIMVSNTGKDPFEILKQVTPDRRPKFKCEDKDCSESSESEKTDPADMNKSENWALMLPAVPEDNVQLVLYDCDYCRERGFKSEGHWRLNCYYYLTGCCPLCGSEEHISPYCPNPPSELTFHQSVMYVRQLAFYYGPPMLDYFPSIYHTLRNQHNELVVWDPIQKKLVAQPIVTGEKVILWRNYDENGMQVPIIRNPFGRKSPLPSPMMSPSICFNNEDKPAKAKAKSPLNSPSLKRMKEEQLEEIIDLELDDLEDPFTIGEEFTQYELTEAQNEFPDAPEGEPEYETEVLDASPVLHPLQQRSEKKKKKKQESEALIPYRGMNPQEHLDMINARSVIPLTLPNTALDPIPFPNVPPADRNELIRRIQSGDFPSDNLVYPIFPVPSSTMFIQVENPQPNFGLNTENRV